MEAEIKKAPAEMKPVMTAIVANWYRHYSTNRWPFSATHRCRTHR